MLLTPLTRRVFEKGKVVESLADQRTATTVVAERYVFADNHAGSSLIMG